LGQWAIESLKNLRFKKGEPDKMVKRIFALNL